MSKLTNFEHVMVIDLSDLDCKIFIHNAVHAGWQSGKDFRWVIWRSSNPGVGTFFPHKLLTYMYGKKKPWKIKKILKLDLICRRKTRFKLKNPHMMAPNYKNKSLNWKHCSVQLQHERSVNLFGSHSVCSSHAMSPITQNSLVSRIKTKTFTTQVQCCPTRTHRIVSSCCRNMLHSATSQSLQNKTLESIVLSCIVF